MKGLVRAALLIVVVLGIGGSLLAYSVVRRGLSTRVAPSLVEERIARAMRHLATPSDLRGKVNPLAADAEVLSDGLAHFADHCAVCHANDGSGSPMGKSLYPPAPDMRAASTQQLSDGELFAIIENGIRLTGMPAWGNGTPEGEASSWALVHFIRRLPRLPPEDVARMEALNPRSPDEFREEEEERRFLAGETGAASPAPAPEKRTHHH
jgi:mono/diheme cytochrome c family protein